MGRAGEKVNIWTRELNWIHTSPVRGREDPVEPVEPVVFMRLCGEGEAVIVIAPGGKWGGWE